MGCVFYSHFLNGTDTTDIDSILRHLEHLVKVGGEDVAALGSDFDGMKCDLPFDASKIQILVEAITSKFGFSVTEKLCFKNAMRIIQ